jgi:hypothetical protein
MKKKWIKEQGVSVLDLSSVDCLEFSVLKSPTFGPLPGLLSLNVEDIWRVETSVGCLVASFAKHEQVVRPDMSGITRGSFFASILNSIECGDPPATHFSILGPGYQSWMTILPSQAVA